MAFLAANRLEVFSALGEDEMELAQIAERTGAHPRSLGFLLNACVALGLLDKRGAVYRNADVARTFLVPGKPAYLGQAIRYAEDLYEVWGGLAESVRTNAPAASPETILGADPEKTRHFVLGMHDRARGIARALAASFDLKGRRHLLDVGGGPGTYSTLFVEQTEGLRATVLDLAPVARICSELIAERDLDSRIDVLPGDYHSTAFPQNVDVVLMSGILHRETAESARSLLGRAFEALTPGGLILVADVHFENDDKLTPPFATLFALNMLLTSARGSTHSLTELSRWLEQAGFHDLAVKHLPPPLPHSVICATKREGGP